uniref:transglutaminase domain-containing protein n=1 Tax=uncultured Proteiniphilum sp. TaxID=497637 RepID=UPI0026213A4D
MKHLYGILFFCFFLLFPGCSHKKNSPLEEVLILAGSNRNELEQVIAHYKANPADSLKLKAAGFLILNMPGKYSEYYEAPWEDVATVNLRWSSSSDKSKVLDTYKMGNPVRRDDVNHITADYLISNIDLAFQVWNDKPWGKYISFDTFCEEILPYRIGTEPLENWREKVLASFADINQSLKEDSTITAVEACRKVNDLLPRFRLDKDFSNMSFTQLMATTRGMCDSQAALAAFVMRGLGIPVTIDFTPQWKSHPTGHSWNSVCDSAGQHISFMGTETNPYGSHQGNTFQKAKAYRKTFRNHRVVETDEIHTPPLFQDNLYDISSEHNNMTSAAIPIKHHSEIRTGRVFLALFYDFEWRLTGHGEVDSDSIRFQHIGKDILYLPIYYTNGNQTPAGNPFYIDTDGKTHVLTPDSPDSLMSFGSITPENDLLLSGRMMNAVFESSQTPDFSETRMIHKITKIPGLYNKVKSKRPETCRYVRYKAPENSYCNVSEIVLYDLSGNKLEGMHVGSRGSHKDLGDTGDKAFDGDITTFYDAAGPEESWTGLDFGEDRKIAAIHYSPRLANIGIYEGYGYELFCWADNGWRSTGKKTATGQTIEFNAP